MMFRYYGIPARYVEGYLITPQMAGKTVQVPRSMAHAWVEIYVDGDNIVLHKYQPACVFCDGTDDVIEFKGKNVCRECAKRLGDKA